MKLCGCIGWHVIVQLKYCLILVYGHDAVLPWEIKAGSRRIFSQDQLASDDYVALMKDELEDLAGHRLKALVNIEGNKKRVARWYDKWVKAKEFTDGDLVVETNSTD